MLCMTLYSLNVRGLAWFVVVGPGANEARIRRAASTEVVAMKRATMRRCVCISSIGRRVCSCHPVQVSDCAFVFEEHGALERFTDTDITPYPEAPCTQSDHPVVLRIASRAFLGAVYDAQATFAESSG